MTLKWLKRILGLYSEPVNRGNISHSDQGIVDQKLVDQRPTPALSARWFLDNPPPLIEFKGKVFCLTGKFAYGPKRSVEEIIVERGGATSKTFTHNVDFLVVGNFASPDWTHQDHGRKIEAAVKYREDPSNREKPSRVAIIHEDHWAKEAFKEQRGDCS